MDPFEQAVLDGSDKIEPSLNPFPLKSPEDPIFFKEGSELFMPQVFRTGITSKQQQESTYAHGSSALKKELYSFQDVAVSIYVLGAFCPLLLLQLGLPWASVLRKKRIHRLTSVYGTIAHLIPLAIAVFIPVPQDAIRIGSGAIAFSSAVTVIPLRMGNGIPQTALIIVYVIWALCFSLYLLMQLLLVPTGTPVGRNLYLFCVIVASVHFSMGLAVQSETTLIDGFTVFGPLVATVSVYLVSLLFSSRIRGSGEASEPEAIVGTALGALCV